MSDKKKSENSPKQRRVWDRKPYGFPLKRLVVFALIMLTASGIASYAYSSWTTNHTGSNPSVGIPIAALNFVMCPVLNVQNQLMGELTANSPCPQSSQVTSQIGFQLAQTTDPTASWTLSPGTGMTIQLVFLSSIPCPVTMPTTPQNDQISSAGSLLNPALVGGSGAPTYLYCIYYTSATTISAGTFTVTYSASSP